MTWHFRYLLQVAWLKEACKRGDHGHPRTPLATPLIKPLLLAYFAKLHSVVRDFLIGLLVNDFLIFVYSIVKVVNIVKHSVGNHAQNGHLSCETQNHILVSTRSRNAP